MGGREDGDQGAGGALRPPAVGQPPLHAGRRRLAQERNPNFGLGWVNLRLIKGPKRAKKAAQRVPKHVMM